jgi:hypothetical protein
MSKESDFLLGWCFEILRQSRKHFIEIQDAKGLALIEDEYQALQKCIERVFYPELYVE